jgi:type VI secretion system protein ImpJ
MRNHPVNWTEGMLLRPQHFQATDRFWQELVATSDRFNHAYNYGLVEIEINEQALANLQLEVIGCKARLHDGTIIAFDASHLDRVDLKSPSPGSTSLDEIFDKEESVIVYLAIPGFVDNAGSNVSQAGGNGATTRYSSFDLDVDDDSLSGNRKPISFRQENICFRFDADGTQGFDYVPICRLRRSASGEGFPEIDPDYFPPCLAINAWPDLGINVVRKIYDMIESRVSQLSKLLFDRDIDWSSQRPGDLNLFYLAGVLNEALGTLRCLAFAKGVHPFEAYKELCRIIGRLSILGPEKRSPDFPLYDHDDLARIFKWAMREIDIRSNLPDDGVKSKFFVGAGRTMRVTVDPDWFTPKWNLYIGIHHPTIKQQELFKVFVKQRPDWKFGSFDQIDEIFEQAKPGVKVSPLQQTPGPLAGRNNWVFLSVSENNHPWQRVTMTNSLAMRLSDEQIYNRDDLDGKRDIIFQLAGKLIELQFALFAVRTDR